MEIKTFKNTTARRGAKDEQGENREWLVFKATCSIF